jgi:hypothetical protein
VTSQPVLQAAAEHRAALAQAWEKGYDAGDLDASYARCKEMGYTVPEDQPFPTPNPYVPADQPVDTPPSTDGNPDLWKD